MASIENPVLQDQGGFDGLMYSLGDQQVFIFEVEEDFDGSGRTRVFAHDEDGDEVEILFHPRIPECDHCGNEATDQHWGVPVCDSCLEDLEDEEADE